MDRQTLAGIGIEQDDVLYVTLKSNVLKVGRYRGVVAPPGLEQPDRLCLALHPRGRVMEFLADGYVKAVEVVARATDGARREETAPAAQPGVAADALNSRAAPGDRMYVRFHNQVVKSGVYLGTAALPDGAPGLWITYDADRNILDLIDLAELAEAEVTIPRAVLESVASAQVEHRA